MKITFTYTLIVLSLLIFLSCENDDVQKRMDKIKTTGDTNPTLALAMLDSLKMDVIGIGKYTQMKYFLLSLRLNDKAYNTATSDSVAKKVVEYFDNNGTEEDRQEAYYYCGSTYRDLKDTPRALEYFLKAMEIGESNYNNCDSLLLENTYSNIHFLFFNVQDYRNSLTYAKKEYGLSKNIQGESILPLIHLMESYAALDSINQAKKMADKVYKVINRYKEDVESLSILIIHLSHLGELQKAHNCVLLLKSVGKRNFNNLSLLALAEYYKKKGEADSACVYYKRILSNNPTCENVYDASKEIFRMCLFRDDKANAIKYAEKYIDISDTLDLGHRQEMAATVNNQFQYHLDKEKEINAKEAAMRYRNISLVISVIFLTTILSILSIYLYKRNCNLNKLLSLSNELDKNKADKQKLQSFINNQASELDKARKSLLDLQMKLEDVNRQMVLQQSILKEKEHMLADKIEQNKTYIRLLHKSDLEVDAQEVINAIRLSADGHRNMSADDWRNFYVAVDKLYPEFREEINERLGKFTEQQMQFLYLMRIGMTGPQIQHLTNIPRVTVWRWTKKFSWVTENNKYIG